MGILKKSILGLGDLFDEDIECEPVGYAFLVVAAAGRGKTTLGYQMMYDYIKNSKRREFGIYITLEQSAKRLKEQFKRLRAFGENPGIIIVDEPFMRQILKGKAERMRSDKAEIEKNLEILKAEMRKKASAAKFIDRIDELKVGMDALYENVELIPFNKGEEREQKAEVEILKKKADVSPDVAKTLVLGKLAGELTELAEREKSVQEILAQFKEKLEIYSKLTAGDEIDFIDYVISDTLARVETGELAEIGIPRTAKLGCVVIDSLQILEAHLGISENSQAVRKEMLRFVRPITEKYETNLIGLLELKHGQKIEDAANLPETYAFDTAVSLDMEFAGDTEKPIYKLHQTGKHRGGWNRRFVIFEIKKGEGIVFAPD